MDKGLGILDHMEDQVGSSSWPSTESTPATSVPSRGHQVEKQAKQTAQSQRQASNAVFGYEDAMTRGQVRYVNYEGQESMETISPAQKEFEMDPAHAFWKWSVEAENWYHKDETTGAILWAPFQLD
ncbi:hypothetical protein GQ607_006825 [Colletotrichum asianum]|uniref:Uncharacterized protein n=1 Tax=Colletotrichum asianum TaxID=702518 RepID=A0A8H3WHN7_9PEZI|nr:hypothetical protein GQ607_006825 [Colletotrichum asianum]